MPKVKRRVNKDNDLNINFDVPMLNALIKYIRCEFIANSQKANLLKLMNNVSVETYNYSIDIQDRVKLLKVMAVAIVESNINDEDVLLSYIKDNSSDLDEILNNISIKCNQLTKSETDQISISINERLQYMHIFKAKDEIVRLLNSLDDPNNAISYNSIMYDLKTKLSTLLVSIQNSTSQNGLLRAFSFSGEMFEELTKVIVEKSKRPASILQTGIRQLNAILSPGFQSGRLYTILGGTGKFKSGTLLNLADQIRLYNPQIIPFENGMRKTVLFVTMENSIEETVIRLYDMYSDIDDDLYDRSPEEVIQTLRDEGKFNFTDNNGIDIDIRYFSNLEITTAHLYTLIQELADNGKEVICLILDYLKRISSTHDDKGEERIRLSYASKELKSLAQFYEIPVITAMQINRDGNSIIDAAMRENKQDVAKFIGTSSVGVSWDVIEESDWVGLINLEQQMSTGQLFLTFKRLKIRGKKDALSVDYFNHPFVNNKNIRLEVDVDKERPVSIISLASDLESIVEKELKDGSSARPRISKSSGTQNNSVLKSIEMTGLLKSA